MSLSRIHGHISDNSGELGRGEVRNEGTIELTVYIDHRLTRTTQENITLNTTERYKQLVTVYTHLSNFALYIPVIFELLESASSKIEEFLNTINDEKSTFAYASGKWTIKELVQHLIDAERIFDYRALCIARKETTSLPSFDENLYADNSKANSRRWKDIGNEFIHLRHSTKDLFESFSEEMLNEKGISNNKTVSVLSLGFIIVGHVTHHIKIVEEKYF